MKKILLSIITLAATLGAWAQATYSGSMLYGHGTTPAYPLMTKSATTMGEAMQFPASAIKALKGCRITAIAVTNGVPSQSSAITELPLKLFTASEVGTTFTPTLTYDGNMPMNNPFNYTEYPLPEPIEITEDMQPLYFGYYGEVDPAKGTCIVVDAQMNESAGEGDWFGVYEEGKWTWAQMRQAYGFGGIRVKVEGDNLPGNTVYVIENHIPTYLAPGSEGQVQMYLQNAAGNDVNSVQITYKVGGGEERTATINLRKPLHYNDYTTNFVGFSFTAPETESDNVDITMKVTGINGNAVNQAPDRYCSDSGYALVMDPAKGYKKNMVAEITTGTWCGFCPQGFVSVSKMLEAHPDGTFIPICVHFSDQMQISAYNDLRNLFTGTSAPSCVVNRNMHSYGVQTPTWEILSQIYQDVTGTPAVGSVRIDGATFNAEAKTIDITASATFALGSNVADYAMAYVITEDNVGPYEQHNYYSTEYTDVTATLEGWTELPEYVDTTFNAVARNIRRFSGLRGSIPESIEAGKTYSHTESVQTNAVGDIKNCHIVVLLVNRLTGRIENAVSAPYSELSSIREVAAPERFSGDASVFDLQGRRVSRPAGHGIYIIGNQKILK